MLKRFLTIFMILILSFSLLVACGNSEENKQPAEEKNQQNQQNQQIEEQTPPQINEEKHRGEYLGQIDNNSIEINVTDEEEAQTRAFQLSEEIKENFSDYNLKSGDQIIFDYEIPEIGNPIITEIEKTE